MGNRLNGNILYFDTAGASSAITTKKLITGIVWDTGDSGIAGDNVVLRDAEGGDVVFQATCGLAKNTYPISFAEPVPVSGLYLTTLDHGVLLVYTKPIFTG